MSSDHHHHCLMAMVIVAMQDHVQCWGGFSWSAFQKWGEYLWLAIPCTLPTTANSGRLLISL